jgi:hypothetical protein
LHFAPHALLILISPHAYVCMLDRNEPELKELVEQAQVEEFTNLALDQGKSSASHHHP